MSLKNQLFKKKLDNLLQQAEIKSAELSRTIGIDRQRLYDCKDRAINLLLLDLLIEIQRIFQLTGSAFLEKVNHVKHK